MYAIASWKTNCVQNFQVSSLVAIVHTNFLKSDTKQLCSGFSLAIALLNVSQKFALFPFQLEPLIGSLLFLALYR